MFPNPRNSVFAMRDATRLAAVSALLAPAAVFLFDLPLMKIPAAFAAAGLFVLSIWWNRLVTLPYWLYVRSIDRVSFQRFLYLATGACTAIIFRYGEAVTGDFVSISLLSIAAVIAVRTTWLLIRSRSARTVRIAPPFASGQFAVFHGGPCAPLNAHHGVPEQRFAVDIVRIGTDGRRASSFYPIATDAFYAFGTPIVSPVTGTIVAAADGFDDDGMWSKDEAPMYGNHVLIRCPLGDLVIAHCKQGSVAVSIGDRVSVGQPIGLIGNSGNSSEPHLHIHLERDGEGVLFDFGKPLYRNQFFTV